jgi:tetratricopeptide (TPR) repeat protein
MKNIRRKVLLTAILATSLMACTPATKKADTVSKNQMVQVVNFDNQRKIDELVQTGIYYYWHGGDLKKVEQEFFKGITLKGKYDVVENSFKEASKLSPYRLDLRFSIASTQVLQGKLDEALETYKGILELEPNNFEANILYAVYSKVNGDTASYDEKLKMLETIDSARTEHYIKTFETTENLLKTKLNTKAYKVALPNHTIVTLGYALADDGTMQPTLIKRLEQTLAMAKLNPNATLIVSGGVPKQGVTEGHLMKEWLVKKGIDSSRIFIDDQAKDTVGNAVYSTEIMKKLGTKNVTLISSASHIRRGLSIYKEVTTGEGLDINFDNLVYLDYDSVEEAMKVTPKEYMVVYRDTLRGSGIWNYPGIQR